MKELKELDVTEIVIPYGEADEKTVLQELILKDETYRSMPMSAVKLLKIITSKKFTRHVKGSAVDMCEGIREVAM